MEQYQAQNQINQQQADGQAKQVKHTGNLYDSSQEVQNQKDRQNQMNAMVIDQFMETPFEKHSIALEYPTNSCTDNNDEELGPETNRKLLPKRKSEIEYDTKRVENRGEIQKQVDFYEEKRINQQGLIANDQFKTEQLHFEMDYKQETPGIKKIKKKQNKKDLINKNLQKSREEMKDQNKVNKTEEIIQIEVPPPQVNQLVDRSIQVDYQLQNLNIISKSANEYKLEQLGKISKFVNFLIDRARAIMLVSLFILICLLFYSIHMQYYHFDGDGPMQYMKKGSITKLQWEIKQAAEKQIQSPGFSDNLRLLQTNCQSGIGQDQECSEDPTGCKYGHQCATLQEKKVQSLCVPDDICDHPTNSIYQPNTGDFSNTQFIIDNSDQCRDPNYIGLYEDCSSSPITCETGSQCAEESRLVSDVDMLKTICIPTENCERPSLEYTPQTGSFERKLITRSSSQCIQSIIIQQDQDCTQNTDKCEDNTKCATMGLASDLDISLSLCIPQQSCEVPSTEYSPESMDFDRTLTTAESDQCQSKIPRDGDCSNNVNGCIEGHWCAENMGLIADLSILKSICIPADTCNTPGDYIPEGGFTRTLTVPESPECIDPEPVISSYEECSQDSNHCDTDLKCATNLEYFNTLDSSSEEYVETQISICIASPLCDESTETDGSFTPDSGPYEGRTLRKSEATECFDAIRLSQDEDCEDAETNCDIGLKCAKNLPLAANEIIEISICIPQETCLNEDSYQATDSDDAYRLSPGTCASPSKIALDEDCSSENMACDDNLMCATNMVLADQEIQATTICVPDSYCQSTSADYEIDGDIYRNIHADQCTQSVRIGQDQDCSADMYGCDNELQCAVDMKLADDQIQTASFCISDSDCDLPGTDYTITQGTFIDQSFRTQTSNQCTSPQRRIQQDEDCSSNLEACDTGLKCAEATVEQQDPDQTVEATICIPDSSCSSPSTSYIPQEGVYQGLLLETAPSDQCTPTNIISDICLGQLNDPIGASTESTAEISAEQSLEGASEELNTDAQYPTQLIPEWSTIIMF